jgi:hypothetical protein
VIIGFILLALLIWIVLIVLGFVLKGLLWLAPMGIGLTVVTAAVGAAHGMSQSRK